MKGFTQRWGGFFQQHIKPAHVRQMSQISQSSEILGIANSTNQKVPFFFFAFLGAKKPKNTNLHLCFSPPSCCQQTFLFSSHPRCAPNGTEEYLPIYIYHQWLSQNVGKHSIHGASHLGMGSCFLSKLQIFRNFSNCKSWGTSGFWVCD